MKKVRTRRGALGLVVIAVGASIALFTAAASSHATAAPRGVMTPAVGTHPIVSAPVSAVKPGSAQFSCQSNALYSGRCYSPQQMQKAYGYDKLLKKGVDGSGQTILIVDAYSNPYVENDLVIEDQTFGLPPANLSIMAPAGSPPAFDWSDNQVGWAGEISLDVLSAHYMAPGAKIILIEAKSNSDQDLYNATKAAVDMHLGNVISNSWGEADTCVPPYWANKYEQVYAEAASEGITVFASSGDSGAAQFDCSGTYAIEAASSPASDWNVTGVGGTSLDANIKGKYLGETAWYEPNYGCNPPASSFSDVWCSGGGYSSLYSKPPYQSGIAGSQRGVPDVSYDAGVDGGVLIHSGVLLEYYHGYPPSSPLFFRFGGTSAGSPQWAALIADADQMAGHGLGNINPALYKLYGNAGKYAKAFNDVTSGNNDVSELGGAGYSAGTGWDPVTGLGTPKAKYLLKQLAK
jgi:subtilase family serine protease